MFEVVAIVALIIFIGWVISRAVRAQKSEKSIKDAITPHAVMYGLACVAGVCSLAYFLSMQDISKFVKVITCILLGIVFIAVAAVVQRKIPGRTEH